MQVHPNGTANRVADKNKGTNETQGIQTTGRYKILLSTKTYYTNVFLYLTLHCNKTYSQLNIKVTSFKLIKGIFFRILLAYHWVTCQILFLKKGFYTIFDINVLVIKLSRKRQDK